MLFSSLEFIVFFTIYLPLHRFCPAALRVWLILIGSAVYYGWWNPVYIWVPTFLSGLAFWAGWWVDSPGPGPKRRLRLIASIAALLAPLLVFKYANFFWAEVLGPVFGSTGRLWDMPWPLGISFITFAALAYVVDVYQGRFAVERRPWLVAGHLSFFTYVSSGPIVRPAQVLPQLTGQCPTVSGAFTLGGFLFAIGLAKKLLIADQIAPFVDRTWAAGQALTAPAYWLAAYGYSAQIFCDLSGYTDMALGLGLMLGFSLPQNFNRPYGATSVADFWRRWHMTLSLWLRDYLYIPLGGNRRGWWRRIINILVTMGLGGLWHGANWTFIVWGLAHGLGIAAAHVGRRLFGPAKGGQLVRCLKIVIVFHFVTGAWVLFRAPNLGSAGRFFGQMFCAPLGDLGAFASASLFGLVLLAVFVLSHPWDHHSRWSALVERLPRWVVWWLTGLLIGLSLLVTAGHQAKFVYYDF